MELYKAETLAKFLLDEHGLSGDWSFRFDNAKRRFGCCHTQEKMITMSSSLTFLNGIEKIKDTLLHEIAHALVREKYGNRVRSHGWEWYRLARSIGCKAERCYDGDKVETPQHNYEATCPKCGKVSKAFKLGRSMKRGQACGICCKKYNFGRYTPEFRLDWKRAA